MNDLCTGNRISCATETGSDRRSDRDSGRTAAGGRAQLARILRAARVFA